MERGYLKQSTSAKKNITFQNSGDLRDDQMIPQLEQGFEGIRETKKNIVYIKYILHGKDTTRSETIKMGLKERELPHVLVAKFKMLQTNNNTC